MKFEIVPPKLVNGEVKTRDRGRVFLVGARSTRGGEAKDAVASRLELDASLAARRREETHKGLLVASLLNKACGYWNGRRGGFECSLLAFADVE